MGQIRSAYVESGLERKGKGMCELISVDRGRILAYHAFGPWRPGTHP